VRERSHVAIDRVKAAGSQDFARPSSGDVARAKTNPLPVCAGRGFA